jgi:hypothetical protein
MLAFKVDENLPSQATKLLCREGYDAVSVLDQRLGGAGDATVASVRKNEGRILITWIQASQTSAPTHPEISLASLYCVYAAKVLSMSST